MQNIWHKNVQTLWNKHKNRGIIHNTRHKNEEYLNKPFARNSKSKVLLKMVWGVLFIVLGWRRWDVQVSTTKGLLGWPKEFTDTPRIRLRGVRKDLMLLSEQNSLSKKEIKNATLLCFGEKERFCDFYLEFAKSKQKIEVYGLRSFFRLPKISKLGINTIYSLQLPSGSMKNDLKIAFWTIKGVPIKYSMFKY